MTHLPTGSRWFSSIGYIVGLAAVWVLLWGSASPANVLSGLLVGAVLVGVVPGLSRVGRPPQVRPLAIARLVRYMLANAVRSNITLIREVISPGSQLRSGVVEVRLPDCSDEVLTIVVSLLALTPGTMPLGVDTRPDDDGPHRPLGRVHVLYLYSDDDVRRAVHYLAGLVIRAFGDPDAVAALPEPGPPPVPTMPGDDETAAAPRETS